jgi:uncharacterized protein
MTNEIIRERVSIVGPQGALAGELAYPTGCPRYACAIFNPHPHMGGSAANPLIAAVAAAVAESGGVSLRFDYAGVADVIASMAAFWETGRAPEDPTMVADAMAAVQWLRRAVGEMPLTLVGYSFGAFVAAECVQDAGPAALAVISPTLVQHDFSSLLRPDCPPLLVVYSDNDFATPLARTQAFVASTSCPVRPHLVRGGEHFFRGVERPVAEVIAGFFESSFSQDVARC